MTVLEVTHLRLGGIVDNYLEVRAHAGGKPGHKHPDAGAAFKGGPDVTDEFYIDNIQKTINMQFPWKLLDMPKPVVPRDGKMGPGTQQALQKIKQIATELNNQTALEALRKIKIGELRSGASELWDSALEIQKNLTTDDKYFRETGKESDWDYQKKLQYMKTTIYPSYFPKPWQAKNMCSFVGGGQSGKFTTIPETESEFRTCQTPRFNHFLMWGPDCPGCGISGSDPRHLRVKSQYPAAFTYEKNKNRRENHIWYPVIPSPGFMPYMVAPPEGSPYYKDPSDPHPETEGVRFFDQADEKWYREYMEKYQQFKQEFGEQAAEYNQRFFDMLPHKKTKSMGIPPNEWSSLYYGRKELLWPKGTMRPPAAELKRIIQERQLGTATASVQQLAEKFKRAYL